MLFGPENGERLRDPRVNRSQAVEASVTAGADRNQEPRLAHAGPTMVDMEIRVPRLTALT
jgi:hypothetical protein